MRAELFCAWASQCGSHGPCMAAEHSKFGQCHRGVEIFFKFFPYLFIFGCLGLHCCTQAFSSCSKRGYSLVVVPMLLTMRWLLLLKRTSLAEVGFWYTGFSSCSSCVSGALDHWLGSCGHRSSCPVACRIFLDQRLNLCFLHWQVDSQPLGHQGSPLFLFKKIRYNAHAIKFTLLKYTIL